MLATTAIAIVPCGVSACGGGQPSGEASGPRAPTVAEAATAGAAVDAVGADDRDMEAVPPPAAERWDEASRRAARAAAVRAMRRFARPRLAPGPWFAALAPLLSSEAAVAFAGTDPANVPARAVTGPPRLGRSASAYLASADVPTNAGTYRVLLSRTGQDAPWLVERLTAPRAVRRP